MCIYIYICVCVCVCIAYVCEPPIALLPVVHNISATLCRGTVNACLPQDRYAPDQVPEHLAPSTAERSFDGCESSTVAIGQGAVI